MRYNFHHDNFHHDNFHHDNDHHDSFHHDNDHHDAAPSHLRLSQCSRVAGIAGRDSPGLLVGLRKLSGITSRQRCKPPLRPLLLV